jgi:hypothetical protein
MSTSHFGRRSVLAGSAAAAAVVSLPTVSGQAQAAAPAAVAKSGYRWRNAVMGGTGFITGVLFHPSVRGLAYARTDIGGAYRWDARTDRWIPLTDHLGWDDWNLLGVEAMAVDPAHPNRVYLALGTYTQPWAGNGTVLRSEDQGATWKRTDLTVQFGANEDGRGCGERLLVDPRNCDTLWLGTRHDGLLKSTDRGATWKAVSFPAAPSTTGQGITLLVAAGRSVYAGWGDSDGTADHPNLYRTSDGKTWEPVPGLPTGTAAKVPIRAAYDRLSRELYMTYANAPGPNGQSDGSVHKLRTTNGKWTEVTPVKPGGATSDGGTDAFGYSGVAVDARRPGTLVVSTNNRWAEIDTVFRSTDGGRTWKSLKDEAVLDVSETPYLNWGKDKPKFGWWIQAVGLDPFDSEHVVYGTGATLYGTRDLKRWAPQIRGLEEASVVAVVSPPTGEAHLISGSRDIGVLYQKRLTASPSRGMATNPVFGSGHRTRPGRGQALVRRAQRLRRQRQRRLVERRRKDLGALRVAAGRRQGRARPDRHQRRRQCAAVVPRALGRHRVPGTPLGGQRRHLVRGHLPPEGRCPGRGPRGPDLLLRLRHDRRHAPRQHRQRPDLHRPGHRTAFRRRRVPAGRGPRTLR